MSNFDLKKFLTENKLTSNAKLLSENKASNQVYVVKDDQGVEKEVDLESIEVDQEEDSGGGYRWIISAAKYADGVELGERELEDLAALYYGENRGVDRGDEMQDFDPSNDDY